MDTEKIRSLIQLLHENHLSEIEIEESGRKIRIVKAPPLSLSPMAAYAAALPTVAAIPPLPHVVSEGPDPSLAVISSPIVGTFYKTGAPGAEPYVKTGDTVKKGQTLCIIEAMKLMNEIESDMDGEVVAVCVEDKSPVEFGQPLFKIKPHK